MNAEQKEDGSKGGSLFDTNCVWYVVLLLSDNESGAHCVIHLLYVVDEFGRNTVFFKDIEESVTIYCIISLQDLLKQPMRVIRTFFLYGELVSL